MILEERRILRHEKTIRGAVWTPLIALGVLVALLLALSYYFYRTALWVQHSSDMLYLGSRSLRLAVDMETGKRGFLLDADPKYLDIYDQTASLLTKEQPMERLVKQTSDNKAQQANARAFRDAFVVWHTQADKDIRHWRDMPSAKRTGNFDDSLGKRLMDVVRAKQKIFIDGELRLKDERLRTTQNVARFALFGGVTVTLLIGGLLGVLTRRRMQEVSEQYETVLEGEARVRERLATTLTSIGDGVVVTDAKGIITLINPVTEELTGWTNEEARGKPHTAIFDIANETTGAPVPSPVEEAIAGNRIVLLANHTVLKRRDGRQIAIEDSASPIRDKNGKVTGVVLVFRDVTARKQQEAELALSLEKNQRIAETLQRSMLITPPEDTFPGMSLATLYEPAWDEALVGGDFFDVYSFWDKYAVFVVGDATGKGLDAAATTSEVKYALRAYLHDDPNPARAMTRLNRFLVQAQRNRLGKDAEFLPLSFISLTVAVIHTETGEGKCAVAGAEVPLVLTANGEAREAGVSGTMLGVSQDAVYDNSDFLLEKGGMVAFVTDGITEARRSRHEFFGYEGFTHALQSAVQSHTLTTSSLDAVAVSIVNTAKEFAGGRLNDDVCLLLAQRQ